MGNMKNMNLENIRKIKSMKIWKIGNKEISRKLEVWSLKNVKLEIWKILKM